MALRNEAGTVLTKAQVTAQLTAVTDPDPQFTVGENIYEDTGFAGSSERGQELKWRAGETVRQSEVDAAYAVPTVAHVAPAVGPAAGGTEVTITGSGFESGLDQNPNQGKVEGGSVTGVTIGGVACTSVEVQDDGTLTCITGAHAAGAVAVVVTNEAGASAPLAAGFTYQ